MPRCIVVGTDGSDTATRAVERAAELARALSSPLHLVSVYSTLPGGLAPVGEFGVQGLADWVITVRTETELMLQGLGQRLAAQGLEVETHAVAGHPVPAILRLAEQLDAQLVVVGNKGMRGLRRILGSVPNAVAHQAPCDVLIVHTTQLPALLASRMRRAAATGRRRHLPGRDYDLVAVFDALHDMGDPVGAAVPSWGGHREHQRLPAQGSETGLAGKIPLLHWETMRAKRYLIQLADAVTKVSDGLVETNQRLASLAATMEAGFAAVDGRLAVMDGRLADMSGRLAVMDGRLAVMDTRLADMSGQIAGLRSDLNEHLRSHDPGGNGARAPEEEP